MDGHFVAFCDEFAWFVRRRNSATFTLDSALFANRTVCAARES